MRELQKVLQKLKNRAECAGRRDGVSMAIVICIGALLLAFSLAMAYTGSLMMATANTRLEKERAYQLAKSFAEVLDEQLTGSTQTEFQDFAKEFISSSFYRDYNDTDDTVYTYTLDTSSALSKNYGSSITVKLYKELNDSNTETVLTGASVTQDTIATAYKEEIIKQETTDRNRYDLMVMVVATYGDIEYTYKTEYKCTEQLRLKLTVTENGQTKRLYYKSDKSTENGYRICTNEDCTSPYKGAGPIYYTLRTDNEGVISRTFTPMETAKSTDTADNTSE